MIAAANPKMPNPESENVRSCSPLAAPRPQQPDRSMALQQPSQFFTQNTRNYPCKSSTAWRYCNVNFGPIRQLDHLMSEWLLEHERNPVGVLLKSKGASHGREHGGLNFSRQPYLAGDVAEGLWKLAGGSTGSHGGSPTHGLPILPNLCVRLFLLIGSTSRLQSGWSS